MPRKSDLPCPPSAVLAQGRIREQRAQPLLECLPSVYADRYADLVLSQVTNRAAFGWALGENRPANHQVFGDLC